MKKSYISFIVLIITCFTVAFSGTFSVLAAEGPAMPSVAVKWANPQKIKSIDKKEDKLVITANINGKTTKLYLEFPNEGGVRFHSDSEGYFIPDSLNKIKYYDEGKNTMLIKSDKLAVRLKYGSVEWSLDFLNEDNKSVYTILSTQMFFGFKDGAVKKVKLRGKVHDDEVIYGLGERYINTNLVGQKPAKLWNLDAGYQTVKTTDSTVASYINVPFMHSNEGYSLYFNSLYGGTADIGYNNEERYELDFNGSDFDFYVYTGTPVENIKDYTNLTGKPDSLPKWAYDYWSGGATQYWSEKGVSEKDENVLLKVLETEIENYNRLGVKPTAVFAENTPSWFESIYKKAATNNMRVFGWTNPQSQFDTHELLTPAQKSKLLPSIPYDDLPHIRNMGSNTFGGEGFIDFTHPNATKLLDAMYSKYISWGLKGLMVDYGEYFPTTYKLYNGLEGEELHNFYSYLYAKGYRDYFESKMGNDHVLFVRAGCAGSQQWGANFLGDQGTTFVGLRLAYNGGLNLSASGFSTWGSDIGGILTVGEPNEQLYLRWLQYGTFSPLMRQHGVTSRNPWSYGKLAEKNFVELYGIRQNIIDLVYNADLKANKTGEPMVQRMAVAFPEQKNLADVGDQYLFADELLVAPVLEDNTTSKKVYFPKGETWTDIWTGEVIAGGTIKTVGAAVNRIPVYIRGGAAIPVEIADNFKIGTLLGDKTYNALVVSPLTGNRTTSYTLENGSVVKTNIKATDSTSYTVTSEKNSGQKVVIAVGTAASSIRVNGKTLTKLNAMPTSDNASGYFVDQKTNTTTIFSGNNWKTIDIVGSGKVLKNLALNAKILSNLDSDRISAIVDNDPTTNWPIPTADGAYAIVDLGETYDADSVVMKWTAYTPGSYSLMVATENPEEASSWKTILNKEKCLGGEERYNIPGGKARYIKICDVTKKGTAPGTLFELEVYGKELADAVNYVYPTFIEEDDSVEEDSSSNNEEINADTNETEDDGNTDNNENNDNKNRKPKYKTITVTNWTTIIIVIVSVAIGVLAVAAVVVFIIIKKKRSRANKDF